MQGFISGWCMVGRLLHVRMQQWLAQGGNVPCRDVAVRGALWEHFMQRCKSGQDMVGRLHAGPSSTLGHSIFIS